MKRRLLVLGLVTVSLLILLGLNCTGKVIAGDEANNKPTFEEWLNKTEHVGQYRDLTILKNLPKEKVIVVRNDKCDEHIKKSQGRKTDGNNDHIQDVLTKLGVPHSLIGKSELEKDEYSLDDKWVVLFNCNEIGEHCCNPNHKIIWPGQRGPECVGDGPHIRHNTKFSDKTIQKIQRFVEAGGYLFTEDLQIQEIIERAFKGTIAHTKFLREKDMTILPAPGTEKHPYLKDVFNFPGQPLGSIGIKWKIDDEIPDIKVLNKNMVKVLIMSPQLVNKKVNSEGPIAVTFSVPNGETGKPAGQVLHVMTHFNKQTSKTGEFALQNLLVNFLMEMAGKRK